MAARKEFSIGDVARAASVSVQTLRVWEMKGLVVPKRNSSGQRRYGEKERNLAVRVSRLRRRRGWNAAAIRSALAVHTDRMSIPESIGLRVRRIRLARKLTQIGAAKSIGISRSFLAAVERGEATLSVEMASRVADCLGVPVTALSPRTQTASRIVRARRRPKTILSDKVVWEELAAPYHAMEPAHVIVPPGAGSGGPYVRPGDTFFFILSGHLVFRINDSNEILRLGPGDSLLVPGNQPSSWQNLKREEARVLYVEHVPNTGTSLV